MTMRNRLGSCSMRQLPYVGQAGRKVPCVSEEQSSDRALHRSAAVGRAIYDPAQSLLSIAAWPTRCCLLRACAGARLCFLPWTSPAGLIVKRRAILLLEHNMLSICYMNLGLICDVDYSYVAIK